MTVVYFFLCFLLLFLYFCEGRLIVSEAPLSLGKAGRKDAGEAHHPCPWQSGPGTGNTERPGFDRETDREEAAMEGGKVGRGKIAPSTVAERPEDRRCPGGRKEAGTSAVAFQGASTIKRQHCNPLQGLRGR